MEDKAATSTHTSSEASANQFAIGQTVRKLDRNILPLMTVFYFLSFLNRTNIGNARVAGLQRDLGLSETQYQISLTLLFIPFLLSEIPSSLLLKVIGPRRLLPSLLSICGFVIGFKGLLAARFFLGIVEGPMLPCIVLYLSDFYTRSELGLRIAIIVTAMSLAGSFSGLLAAAISLLDGLGGKHGWSWIFIIEGTLTLIIGISGFFLVTPSLAETKFLAAEEKEVMITRLQMDRNVFSNESRFDFKAIRRALLSPHVVMSGTMTFFNASISYGLNIFMPSIVHSLGFSPVKSQLLGAGPFVCAFLVALLTACLSDKFNCRSIPIACGATLSAIGFVVYLASTRPYILYGSLYLTVSGSTSINPLALTWASNNSEPHYCRAFTIGLMSVFANSGGILSMWTYPKSAAPKYQKTNIMNLIFTLSTAAISIINAAFLSQRNKEKRDPLKREKILALYLNHQPDVHKANLDGPESDEHSVEAHKRAWLDLGDRHPDFEYTL